METKKATKTTFSGTPFDDVRHFLNEDKQFIFCKHWKPKDPPKGLVLIVHGYAEHCARYDPVAEMFNALGLYAFSHDHVGHGESEGTHVAINDYNILIRDLLHHVNLMKVEYPGLPLYLFAHSMGAGLSILFAHQNPGLFKCVALSAPLIESCQKTSSVQLMAMRYLSSWFPNLGVGVIDPNTISRDKEQVENYKTDPLIYHGKVLLCTAYQMHRMMEDIKKVLPEISYPFLLIHGTSDGLCEFSASEEMHVKAKSSDKTFKIYQEGYHELIHEINDVPEQFLADVKEWFEKRLL
ncbi:unnamed protein product [Clavelina lepadiformis]|uniref:Serine aminopeptidase S33 domain-containing protein n=1 Tax=Clavelina lepadiformis TaxID=159417 RepID=A0ABP0GG57_CLALP